MAVATVKTEYANQFLNHPEGKDYTTYEYGDGAKIPENRRLVMMSRKENSKVTNELDKHLPTDRFCFSQEDLEHLGKMVIKENKRSFFRAHSDLFFAHQIPITDCEINVTLESGYTVIYRIHIYDDYIEILNHLDDKMNALMGYITVPVVGNPGYITCPIYVNKVDSCLLYSMKVGFYNMPECLFKEFVDYVDKETFVEVVGKAMNTWYMTQLLLLHPQIKEVFRNPENVRNYSDTIKKNPQHNKKKLCYIKKHVISEEKVKRVSEANSHNTRHALLWHVIGHWRTYKSGKKVFIQPYWKGVLRDTKTVETRDRVFPK